VSAQEKSEILDAVVVGGGPVGLFLGCRLAQLGVSCAVLEKSTVKEDPSRAIGIHPPSLEMLQQMLISDRFLERGRRVYAGRAFGSKRPLGSISFRHCRKPFNFVLMIPPYDTVSILEHRLREQAPSALRRGTEIRDIVEDGSAVTVTMRNASGQTSSLTSRFVIGCDGRRSIVRQKAQIWFRGREYPNTFIMADFEDRLGTDEAHIYLHRDGVVETLPLPNGMRRWVIATDQFHHQPLILDVCKVVRDRLGIDLAGHRNTMISPFGVQKYIARSFFKDRLILAGDSAHLMPPFGGQGMNVGWMDAWDVAETLRRIVYQKKVPAQELARYEKKASARALRAVRRAEVNLALGSRTENPTARNLGIWLALHSPARWILARIFSMRFL